MRFTIALIAVLVAVSSSANDKPRVFISNSESWFAAGGFAVSNGSGGGGFVAGSSSQTGEVIADFAQLCPSVMVTNDKDNASLIVAAGQEFCRTGCWRSGRRGDPQGRQDCSVQA